MPGSVFENYTKRKSWKDKIDRVLPSTPFVVVETSEDYIVIDHFKKSKAPVYYPADPRLTQLLESISSPAQPHNTEFVVICDAHLISAAEKEMYLSKMVELHKVLVLITRHPPVEDQALSIVAKQLGCTQSGLFITAVPSDEDIESQLENNPSRLYACLKMLFGASISIVRCQVFV